MKRLLNMLILTVGLLALAACDKSGESPVGSNSSGQAQSAANQASPQPATAKDGEGFVRIPQPVRTANPDKIEVVEVFWYGCSHCYQFAPMVSAWAKKLPSDVEFHYSPAMWNDLMALHARAFYTAKALGVLDKVHQPIYDAINTQQNPLDTRSAIEKLFLEHTDVDAETFRQTFESFGVKAQVTQADARARSYGIAGTPELIVNGKYRVTGRAAGGKANMLKVAEQLIAKERAAQ